MARRLTSSIIHNRLIVGSLIVVIALFGHGLLQANSNHLENRSLQLSDNRAATISNYQFSFQPTSLDTIQLVRFQICANDPFSDTPCTPPVGLDASHAILTNQSGDSGFSIDSRTSANELYIARSAFPSAGQQDVYQFSGIVNPSAVGSYYVRIQTYSDTDTNVGANNYGGLAFAIAQGVSVTAVVPPYLLFCVGVTVNGLNCRNVVGDYVNFGELSSRQASQGSTQMLAASNARDGYAIRVTGNPLTSGTNVIPGLVGADISRPGVSQFGMNLRANSSPQGGNDTVGSGSGLPTNGYNQVNFYRFNTGDVVAASTRPDEARKYTVSYIVNVAKDQSPGVYVSTVTYIALGSY